MLALEVRHYLVGFCGCMRHAPKKCIFDPQEVQPPEDVKLLFKRYSENDTMTIDNLLKFLIEYQGEMHAAMEDAQAIFNSLKHLKIFQRRGLHLDAFFRYLLGDLNLAHSPALGVHHDMDAPLAHYFISTGHNSYLTGNQLSSDSSIDPIIRALRGGVRVIELDLWPNSKKDNVDVCHGGTLTKPVDFLECLRAIKENAFLASGYPLVLTFEDHLTPNLQAKVAQMVNRTFKGMLFRPGSKYWREFPSPAFLKNKIIISTKPPKEFSEHLPGSYNSDEVFVNNEPLEKGMSDSNLESDDGEDEWGNEDAAISYPNAYKRLIAIHAGKPKGGKEQWLTSDFDKVKRVSLCEQALEDVVKTNGTDIVRFTQRNLLRVYPRGTRFDSSNYNPFIGWMHGAQMVAFNMQGYGKYLYIMHGMFRANGGCGYVKKPDFLLSSGPDNMVFDPGAPLPVKTLLRVKVYLGEGWHFDFSRTHFDQFSPPDFFVRVGIAGAPADKMMRQTRAVQDKWAPAWDEEFEFRLTVPELAVVRVEVKDYNFTARNAFGGQACLPVMELRSGIRAVQLHDHRGVRYKSVKLLMGFHFLHTSTEPG